MGTQVIAKKKRVALIGPPQSTNMKMHVTHASWRSEIALLPVRGGSLVERGHMVTGVLWYQYVTKRSERGHELRRTGEILHRDLYIDDILGRQLRHGGRSNMVNT